MNDYIIKLVGSKTNTKVTADENYLDNNFVTFIKNGEAVMRINASKIVFVKKVD